MGHFRNILGHFWPFSPSDPFEISKNHTFWNSSFRLRQLIETYAPVQDQCASIHPSMVLPWSIHPSMVQTEGRIVTLSIAHHRPPNHYDASTVNLPSLPFPSMSPILSDILILTKTKDIYDRIFSSYPIAIPKLGTAGKVFIKIWRFKEKVDKTLQQGHHVCSSTICNLSAGRSAGQLMGTCCCWNSAWVRLTFAGVTLRTHRLRERTVRHKAGR